MAQDITVEEIMEKLGDWKWRLNNLYFVRDEKGDKVPFQLNETQVEVADNLHFLNIIPKARQLGMCLDPDTKVLTADLQWIPLKNIVPGTQVVSVDEFPQHKGSGQARKMRTGVVEGVVKFKRDTYRISFDDGSSLVCTAKHPWLARKVNTNSHWLTIEGEPNKKGFGKRGRQLTVGTKIRRITKPWDGSNYDDGWVGGMLDGEGSLSVPSRAGSNISISQVEGPVWDRLIKYFTDKGYHYRIEYDSAERKSKYGKRPVNKVVLSGMSEIFRLIGQTRPARFIGRYFWEDKELPYCHGEHWATISKIEHLGEREVIDLQTSLGTYIAEGFVSHNTTFFTLFYLDQVLFSENKIAGIIAHREEDMKKIFRNKILFALEHLPPEIKTYIGAPKIETANELVFPNGGNIFVSLSTRSGTVNFLHISEYGYICAHAPEKADEILNGAINSVHAGQMISIESTAEGRQGHFYRLTMQAEKLRKENRHLTPLDFKIMFFPWWKDVRYTLSANDTTHTIIDDELLEYFDELAVKHQINLTKGQMAWYAKKKALLNEGMFQEFPSTLDEAFMESLEGAYYSTQMAKVYQEKRIGFFPVDPASEVNTAWDLGMNDNNTIVFFQEIGPEIRIVDYYENSSNGLDHYVKILREKATENNWRYGRHILPHDAAVRDLSAVGGITREQVLWDLGLWNTQVAKKVPLLDGIEKVRQLFPRFRFNEATTKLLTDYLANYRRDYDKKSGTWKNLPHHGPESHAADAVRQLATSYMEQFFLPTDGSSAGVQISSFDF